MLDFSVILRVMAKYRNRIADVILARKLDTMGAVLVEGPKWCGKTTTCKQFAKSILDLSDPDVRDHAVEMAEIDIKPLLDGATPRLIDEWQDVPKFWDAIRHRVDVSDGCGHFSLSIMPMRGRQTFVRNRQSVRPTPGISRIPQLLPLLLAPARER